MAILRSAALWNFDLTDFRAVLDNGGGLSAGPRSVSSFVGQTITIDGDLMTLSAGRVVCDQTVTMDLGGVGLTTLGGSDLEFSAGGRLTGGMLCKLTLDSPDGGFSFSGFSVDAADLVAAARTGTQTDDRALMLRMLAGDDLVLLAEQNDLVRSGAGDDVVRANAGDDAVRGGTGADLLYGCDGNDRLAGELGDDYIRGGSGDDRLFGGDGDDIIGSGTGADIIYGGDGTDCFVFGHCQQVDSVMDFDPNGEFILVESGARDFSEVTLVQDGRDALVGLFHISIRFVNVDIDDLTAEDFMFVGTRELPQFARDIIESADFTL